MAVKEFWIRFESVEKFDQFLGSFRVLIKVEPIDQERVCISMNKTKTKTVFSVWFFHVEIFSVFAFRSVPQSFCFLFNYNRLKMKI